MSQYSIQSHTFQDLHFFKPAIHHSPFANRSSGVGACLSYYPPVIEKSPMKITQINKTPEKPNYQVKSNISYDELCINCANKQLSAHKEISKKLENEEIINKTRENLNKSVILEKEALNEKIIKRQKEQEIVNLEIQRLNAKKALENEQNKVFKRQQKLYEYEQEKLKEKQEFAKLEAMKNKEKYRNQLREQINRKNAEKQQEKIKSLEQDKHLSGLNLSRSNTSRLLKLQKECVEYNKEKAEKSRSRSPMQKVRDFEENSSINKMLPKGYIEALNKAKQEREKLRNHYKNEIEIKELSRKKEIEFKKFEQVKIEQNLVAMRAEIENEKRKAMQNQVEIRKILETQIKIKNIQKEQEKILDSKLYGQNIEKGENLIENSHFKQCKMCNSPLK